MRLWKFVRTVRNNARIAALVRTLNVGNWGFYSHAVVDGLPSPIQVPPNQTEWIRCAIQDTGLGGLGDSILDSLSRRDRRPLMGILLASVPNLSTLYAHVPRSDAILEVILKKALHGGTSSPLYELKELYLFAEVPVLVENNHGSENEAQESFSEKDIGGLRHYFKLDYLWPIFYLPNIRTLLLYDLDPTKAAEYLDQPDGVCHVEELYIVGYGMKKVFTIADTQALSTRTGRLKS